MRLHRPARGPATASSGQAGRSRSSTSGRPAPSAPPTTRRRSSSRRRPGRPPARCRRRRAGRRSRRRRPRAGSPRGWRCGSTSRSRWRTRSAARGRSTRSGCPASRCRSGTARATVERRRRPRVDRGPERRHLGQRGQRLVERRRGASRRGRPPRLAASIAPGPPPVATTWRAPSARPSRAASAYAGVAALQRVAAHHADQRAGRRTQVGQRLVDRRGRAGPGPARRRGRRAPGDQA